ncbi:LOW QUALITY PROTEIN: proline-rich basic protein 1 [Pogoniulus pusillus]|uniref:LOW QUALITY PROTEIN: proline-rich basic protein 1 n=1 Tax=Pogoniulus pusillus TaxID=488313 RepID=UPI0030B99FCB
MPRGKRDAVLLSHPELPVTDGEGPRSGVEGRRSTSEEEGHLPGHLPGLPRDDLAKSMSGSSVSSYHSALCSDGTETFKDCLEFLDEEAPVPRDAGQRGSRAEGTAPGRWAVAGGPSVPPPPVPLARPRQAQLSVAAKNSPALGQGGRIGPLGGDRQPATAATTASRELPPPPPPEGMLGGAPSDSDEADGEVRALTARAFRSLSGLPGAHLDMCSSHTSSSLSNSLSEDGGRPRRWPVDSGEPRGTALLGLLGKEQFECVDVELESGEARKGYCKKRTVPKRQILLKRKERKETSFGPRGDISVPQPLPPTRKDPLSKGRAIGEDFKLNYKQFMKTASLDTNADKTRAASCLVKNVLAKKMQYEQMIKMEQKGLRGSSTSSGPSSTGTDLLGDGLEGKSSSLSRSDCSFSAEDLRGSGMLTAAADTATVGDSITTHPAKGVVLSEAMRENVCKLKKTFNELNERMKYQEVLEGHRLPDADEEPESERTRYRRARALFEAHSGVGKALDVAPRFERVPKPWPSLRERAICPSHPQPPRCEANSRVLPSMPSRHLFTSRAQDVKLLPQSQQEEKPPVVSHQLPNPGSKCRGSPPAPPPKPKEKGKGCIPQPRDVRKLVKNSYSLCFGTASSSRSTSRGTAGGTMAPASSGEPPPTSPLVIHCTSVRRQEPVAELGDEEVLAATGQEPAPACAEGPTKLPSSQASPTQGSPVNITRVQATRRGVAAAEGPPASPPRRERSELRVPPRAAAAEGVPHVETHLHVLVGRRSPASASFGASAAPSPAAGREGSPAPSSAVLRTEKTLLLPPSPSSPTEAKEGRGRGGTAALQGAEELESTVQQRSSSDRRDPQGGPPAGDIVHPQPEKPAAGRAPQPPTREQRQKQPVSQPASAGSGGFAAGTVPAATLRAGEGGEGASGQPPEQREAWERSPKWPAVTEPQLPSAPADTSNYLAIPVKASRSSPMPKLPLVPSPATASSGTSAVPNTASTPFGTPLLPSLASTSSGTSVVPNPASISSGTPLIPHPASISSGTPLIPHPASISSGTPLIPHPASISSGTPLIPNAATVSFGSPLVPSPSNMSFGSPFVPNPASMSFGTPLVPNPTSVSFGISAAPNQPTSTLFGTPMVPNMTNSPFGYPSSSLASTSFGTSLVSNPTTKSFGAPLIPYPSSPSFGTPLVPSPSFGSPLVPNPSSASFGSPLITNPIPTTLRHPSVSSVASSSFGSPLVPNPASVPLGTGLHPLPGGEAPWSKLGPEPPLPQPPEGLVTAEHPLLLPSAQPQPRLEDPAHFLRRTDGASPSSKTMPSPTKAFAPHLPPHRRMLVDPDSGKCYYMEPPRQPQLKTLYDPETGQYLEVLIPPVASHTGLYQAPFNPLVMAPGVYGSPQVPYGSFPGLTAPQAPSAPSPVRPDQPAAENPSFSGTFSSAPKGEGPPAAGGPDCGYLESLYYIPTGMRASPGPSQPPAHASPAEPEKAPMLRM